MVSFFKRTQVESLFLRSHFGNSAIHYQIILQGKSGEIEIRFPLTQVPIASVLNSDDNDKIAMLEMLYNDGFIDLVKDYELPYQMLYELDNEICSVLSLPVPDSDVNVELDSTGIVGTQKFAFNPIVTHPKYGRINRFSKRFGPLYVTESDEVILLPKETYLLINAIENPPVSSSTEENLRYFAEVKQLAKDANASLSSYVDRENYSFIDDVEIDAILSDQKTVSLFPKYKSDDPNLQSTLDELSKTSSIYSVTGKEARNRVLVSRDALSKSKDIKEIKPIQGSNVPRFVENPAAFIPESIPINLEEFGERVKNLGIRVYKTQPYIHGNQNERGWFEFEYGAKSIDKLNPDSDENTLDMDYFSDLVKRAKETNESHVLTDDGIWIEIPDNATEFINAGELISKQLNNKKELDPTSLPYVLEIFTNLDQVEFNQPLIEVRQAIEDNGILDPPPSSFKADLFPYQTEGFRWLKLLDFRNMGGLLADDMGLGKTVQVIAFLSHLKAIGKIMPSLIIAPLSLLENWKAELLKFCPQILAKDIYIHQGSTRLKEKKYIEQFDVVLVSYDTLVRDQLLLGKIDWTVTICDEAQKIKNASTATATVVKALKSKFRLALTGTPVENGLSELWSIIDYVQPGLLGSLKYFRETYETPLSKNDDTSVIETIEDSLLSKIQPIYKRRTKLEHLSDVLPKKEKITLEVPLGPEQEVLYRSIIEKVVNKNLNGLQAIHALRQVCSHPALFNSSYDQLPISSVPKLLETLKIIKNVKKNNEKVLIFTDYKKMQVILRNTIMREFNIIPEIINGETSLRQDKVNLFNNSSGFNVMILSPKAAGVGLTITGANHVIHYTRWWNPAVENQSTDRAYRIGQKKDVKVYFPIVNSKAGRTMEQILDKLLREKENLAEKVIVPSRLLDCNDELLKELQSSKY
ncbi:DEAD/DEAH box helicase [Fredinandcohnia sp. 179-A 10B2 NHS]|uniref:DEAD/DEAH box helicase n=1 Tax=Fredinandcohnia sp. 179-A 10B2 NHS TaxID=3235176 RepID=UPI0039A33FB8